MNRIATFAKMHRDGSWRRCLAGFTREEFVVRHQLGKSVHLSNGSRIRSFERSLPILL
jgi:hypothetical protein